MAMATAYRSRPSIEDVRGWLADAGRADFQGRFARIALRRGIVEGTVNPELVPRSLWPTEQDVERYRDDQAWEARRRAKRALQGAGA